MIFRKDIAARNNNAHNTVIIVYSVQIHRPSPTCTIVYDYPREIGL